MNNCEKAHFRSSLLSLNVPFLPYLYKAELTLYSWSGKPAAKVCTFWFHLPTHACEMCRGGGFIILPDLIAKGNPCISSPLTSRRRLQLAAGSWKRGEGATKRVVSVPCGERGEEREWQPCGMTGTENPRELRRREGESFLPHLSETFNRVKCGVLV